MAARRLRGAWGNALGGFKTQSRDARGRFGTGTRNAGVRAKHATMASKRAANVRKNPYIGMQAGVVPYSRHSLRSHSVGINAGSRISPKYRVSVGGYAKIERVAPTNLEKRLKAADDAATQRVVSKMSPHPLADKMVEAIYKKGKRSTIDAVLGGEKALGAKSYARLSTNKSAMPVITIEHNRKRKRDKQARRRAQWAYNDLVTKNLKGSQARPQRRGK